MKKVVVFFAVVFSMVIIVCGISYCADNAAAGKENKEITKEINLPQPRLDSQCSVEKAIKERRSIRKYKDEPLSLADVSQLLWAAQGITEPGRGLRTAPSAMAKYPLEIYIAAGKVDGLEPGIYKYHPQTHSLSLVTPGDRRSEMGVQGSVKSAPVTIIITAVYERFGDRLKEAAVRFSDLEAGHAAQNVYLQAVALDLGTVVCGAFNTADVMKLLGADKESPIYLMPVGKK